MRIALVLLAVLAAALVIAAPAMADVERGPKGDAFYDPPSPLTGKRHGAAIWVRKLSDRRGVENAAKTMLVLYRSETVNGDATAVSGTLMLPEGKPPKRRLAGGDVGARHRRHRRQVRSVALPGEREASTRRARTSRSSMAT